MANRRREHPIQVQKNEKRPLRDTQKPNRKRGNLLNAATRKRAILAKNARKWAKKRTKS